MSAGKSKLVVGAAVCVASLVLVTTAAQSERPREDDAPKVAAPSAAPVAETAQQRRQRLNLRMAEMLRSGEGARLVQPPAEQPLLRRAAPRATAPRPATTAARSPARPDLARPAPMFTDTGLDEGYQSTIAPPPYRGGPPRRAGRGYTPPRLDLTTPPLIPASDVECLTQAIYYEARNESADGQAAVAEVVMNRSRSGAYPQAVCAVVYQRNSRTCQFTFTCDGAIGRDPVDMRKWARAERIAREVYEGRSATVLPSTSLNYHANYVQPSWGARLERVRQIGAHIFYGAAHGGAPTPGAFTPVRAAQTAPRGLVFARLDALDRAFESLGSASPGGGSDAEAAPQRP